MEKRGGKKVALLRCRSAVLRRAVEVFPVSPANPHKGTWSSQRNGSCSRLLVSVAAGCRRKGFGAQDKGSIALQCVPLGWAFSKPYLPSSWWSCHLWRTIVGNRAIIVISGERKTIACHQFPSRSFYRGEKPSPGLLRGRRCNSKGFSFRTFLSLNKIRRSVLTPGFPFLSC